jgi:predicted transcriptional regulator
MRCNSLGAGSLILALCLKEGVVYKRDGVQVLPQ